MRKTKTSSTVKDRYNAKAYDNITVRVYKGRKAEIKVAADAAGESVNQYIAGAVDMRMAGASPIQENAPQGTVTPKTTRKK